MEKQKFGILTLVFFLAGFIAQAQFRSAGEAAELARSFLHSTSGSALKAPSSVSTLKAVKPFRLNPVENTLSDWYFHVFNVGNQNGFIIVSAHERAKTILGYSDKGYFDSDNMPENLREWLGVYAAEITQLENLPVNENNAFEKINKSENDTDEFTTSVAPLLKSIKWNQNSPYNLLCPIIDSTNNTRAAVGCGATALAQVMKYYNWPPAGTGSNSYTTTTLKIPLSVNFAATQYDWANMTGLYNAASTEVQKNAVATLMYHCAVAVNMDFNRTSSSFTTDIARALFKYFGYDSNAQIYIRNYYTRSEWESRLKSEINAGRPVLYNGQASDGGHIFVCDGYDANGFYHINWGWGGISDGYFELSALNPNELGIGGGNAGGYNTDQYIITGIQKPSSSSVPAYLIYTNLPLSSSVSQTSRSGSFNITMQKVYNYGVNTITGSMGLGLYNGNTLVQVLTTGNITLNSFYGWKSYSFNNLTIPAGVANGNYKIHIIYKPNTTTDWTIARGKVGTPNYLDLKVETTAINITVPSGGYPSLLLQSLETTGNLYSGKTGRFKARITNTGSEYNSRIAVFVEKSDNNIVRDTITTDPVNIAAGETREVEFSGILSVDEGLYKVGLLYDVTNNTDNQANLVLLGNVIEVQIKPVPSIEPKLTLNSTISFPDPQNIFMSNATLTANITNLGGYFEEKLIAFIFPATSGSSLTYIGYQTGILDANETKTINFSGSVALDAGNYRIGVYYWNPNSTASSKWTRIAPNESSLINFTLKEDLTDVGFNNIYPDPLFPNPATDYIYLKAEKKVDYVSVFDITGKLLKRITPSNIGFISLNISDLNNGAYLLYVQSSEKSTVHKFLKK